MAGIVGGDGSTDPQKLEGRDSEDSKHREFFWDSVSLYVVGVIIALAAVDVVTEFLRGSAVSCFSPPNETITEAQENYINSFCSASLPPTEYFPVFIVIHAILIAIPHYLWLNHYGGNFEFFFAQAKEMDRTRSEETGDYSEKNRIIIQQLTQAFTTYKENWMFLSYVLKLVLQLVITVTGFLAAILAFTDFRETFMCPRIFNASSPDPFWPFDSQVGCVFTSLRLFSSIHLADLILLALLTLSFLWSLIWCASTHPTELSTDEAALFCFQSCMAPEHYIPKFPIKGCLHPVKRCMQSCFTSVSVIGRGPMIRTNLDFLVLKLFRTDSGLGFIFREMQILEKIRHHNDDDQRRTNLHKRQQDSKALGDGDLITPLAVKGSQGDIKWKFTKVAGEKGILDRVNSDRLLSTETLVLPDSLRGTIVGLSSLAPRTYRALFVNFGSVSLGIPSALSRVFNEVGVVNFNPYFKQPETAEKPYENNTYASDIIHVMYQENVLSSDIAKSCDFTEGLKAIWGSENVTLDFIVIGPVDNELHLSTVSLFLTKIAKFHHQPKTRFSQGCVLVTVYPREIAAKETRDEFHRYVPPKKYFEPFAQKVHVDETATDLEWPPKVPVIEPEGASKSSIFDLRVLCGNSHSSFMFSLYKYPPEKPPQSGGQASASTPQKPQSRRSSSGYTAVSFTADRDGGIQIRDGTAQTNDPSKVYYSEVSVAQQKQQLPV